MDVNNTRFHLLIGRSDWEAQLASSPSSEVVWDEQRQRISLRRRLLDLSVESVEQRLKLEQRRGADRDRYGNWYWIAVEQDHILIESPGMAREVYWPVPSAGVCSPAPPSEFRTCEDPVDMPWELSSLAVTDDHYLVVGVRKPFRGILLFDLHAGGIPSRIEWPTEVAFDPWDMSARPGGGVWILDGDEIKPKYWALDRYFRPEPLVETTREEFPSDFVPVSAKDADADAGDESELVESVSQFPEGIPLSSSSPPDEPLQPVSIEALPDQSVLILFLNRDDSTTWLARYRFEQQLGDPVRVDDLIPAEWRGHDMAVVPATDSHQIAGVVYVVGDDGRQAFAFDFTTDEQGLQLRLRLEQFLLRRFGGRALAAEYRDVFADINDRWLALRAKPRIQYETSGQFETTIFDGKEPDCVWHRLLIDGCIPAGTQIRFESRAANQRDDLEFQAWQREPLPYLRRGGAEIPYYRPFPRESQTSGSGTWEFLFQAARGRYLQLRVTFEGTERDSPAVGALRVHYPRFSYLRTYLPDVYQQPESFVSDSDQVDSASMVERFLANAEGTLTELEGKIAELQVLFDERTIPTDYLAWLASWLGLLPDPSANSRKRRLFIRHAVRMYRQRGTPLGVWRAVELALEEDPDERLFTGHRGSRSCRSSLGGLDMLCGGRVRIVEQFLTRRRPGVVYGDPTDFRVPRLTGIGDWSPEQGAQPLHARFREYLRARFDNSVSQLRAEWGHPTVQFQQAYLSPIVPQLDSRTRLWRAFIRSELGFTYNEVTAGDVPLYRRFLREQYRNIDALNAAYSTSYAGFGEIELPGENDFPQKDARLVDWIRFVSLVVPVHRHAHRFTVLVPLRPEQDPLEQQTRIELARRVVDLEKPAHTDFEVKPYWELYQVGTARLGLDTRLDRGSRFTAILLGSTKLAAGYLGEEDPHKHVERTILPASTQSAQPKNFGKGQP